MWDSGAIVSGATGGSFMAQIPILELVTVSDEFYGVETLLTSHENSSFSLLIMSVKSIIFNVMKPFMKPPLRLT